jgi:hypothetical protein
MGAASVGWMAGVGDDRALLLTAGVVIDWRQQKQGTDTVCARNCIGGLPINLNEFVASAGWAPLLILLLDGAWIYGGGGCCKRRAGGRESRSRSRVALLGGRARQGMPLSEDEGRSCTKRVCVCLHRDLQEGCNRQVGWQQQRRREHRDGDWGSAVTFAACVRGQPETAGYRWWCGVLVVSRLQSPKSGPGLLRSH